MRASTATRGAARLTEIIGHGAKGAALARRLYTEGVRTRRDLRRPGVFARLPKETQLDVMFHPTRRIPLAAADRVASEVSRRLAHAPAEGRRSPHLPVVAVGGARRRASTLKDLDFLVIMRSPDARGLGLRPKRHGDRLDLVGVYSAGARRLSGILRDSRGTARRVRHYRVDFFAATAKEMPFALFHYTGSAAYNIRTRALAKKHGLRLNQYGVFSTATGRAAHGASAIRTEHDLARFLGVTFRQPWDRAR